jgi:hypothetical protein
LKKLAAAGSINNSKGGDPRGGKRDGDSDDGDQSDGGDYQGRGSSQMISPMVQKKK